jgi:7-cyano-7-deazaguanine synthase
MSTNAVVLVSGGLDSTTMLAMVRQLGHGIYALSVDYGAIEHKVLHLDLRQVGGSALTADVAVPMDRTVSEMNQGVPVTYVPARNTILLGLALGYAESVGALNIFFGPNALDYAGYPDCRPEFVAAFEQVANLGTKTGTTGERFRIHTPLITMTKADIIRAGIALGVDYSLTSSCYSPDGEGRACGHCDACTLRKQGFAEAGIPDPTIYQSI